MILPTVPRVPLTTVNAADVLMQRFADSIGAMFITGTRTYYFNHEVVPGLFCHFPYVSAYRPHLPRRFTDRDGHQLVPTDPRGEPTPIIHPVTVYSDNGLERAAGYDFSHPDLGPIVYRTYVHWPLDADVEVEWCMNENGWFPTIAGAVTHYRITKSS